AYSGAMGGFWAVTKYADIVRVLTDWQTFTTTIQNVVPRVATTQRRCAPTHARARRRLSPGRRRAAAVRARAGAERSGAQAPGATDCRTDWPLARAFRAHYTRHRGRVSGVRSGRGGADQRAARGLDHVPDCDGP